MSAPVNWHKCLVLSLLGLALSARTIGCDYSSITEKFGAEAVARCNEKCPFQVVNYFHTYDTHISCMEHGGSFLISCIASPGFDAFNYCAMVTKSTLQALNGGKITN
ncbi:unnamed protein product [Leptosia nina]|uniref:Uncharacterized protein n=1 Tax=Leptosia nina TaxID=320188 RepID=A0AAV1K4N1_9NEOP